MKIDFSKSQLILNPRLTPEARITFENAWHELKGIRFGGVNSDSTVEANPHFGIATSGSSGDPFGRLIVLSRTAIFSNAAVVNAWFGSNASDIWMKTLPVFHVGGLGILARAELSGAKVVESKLERWIAVEFYRELENSGATLLSLVSTQLFDLIQLGYSPPASLRAVILGGSRLSPSLRAQALELRWPVFASYGLTECCSQVATEKYDSENRKSERLFPLSHVAVRIGEDKRIELKGSSLLSAKINFRSGDAEIQEHGIEQWFRTDDLGCLESDGSLTILGRSLDFVKIGGEGVVLSRLEDRLEQVKLQINFNEDAVVLSAGDKRLGAVIVLLTTGSEERSAKLMELFNEGVMPFERIRSYHRLARLPRSELGKILRSAALAEAGLEAAVN